MPTNRLNFLKIAGTAAGLALVSAARTKADRWAG